MARIRQIKPDFYLDDELAQCSRDARLMFPGLWMLADRAGRLADRPARIKAQIFPYDSDITVEMIDGFLGELHNLNFIIRYAVGLKRYIEIRTFKKNQHCHPKEPVSQIPPPPKVTVTESAEQVQEPGKPLSSPFLAPCKPLSSPSASTSTSGYMGTASGEGERLTPIGDIPRGEPENGCPPARPIPPVFEITEKLKAWILENVPSVDLEAELAKFTAHYRANGKHFVDWEAVLEKWLLNVPEFSRSRANRSPPRESRAEHNRRVIAEAWEKLEQGRSP